MELNNILKGMVSYDSNKIEETILNLNQELKEQQQINTVLKDKDFEKKSKKVLDFIERNDGEITDQIYRLAEVVSNLKKVVKENSELDEVKEDYEDLVNSDKSVEVANKLQELKKIKKSAMLFFREIGDYNELKREILSPGFNLMTFLT